MESARHASALLLSATLSTGCSATIPSGVFGCDSAADCPAHFVCRGEAEGAAKYCFARDLDAAPGDAQADAAPDAALPADDAGQMGAAFEPAAGSFTTLNQSRTDDVVLISRDGFELGPRLCTANGELCLTGSFEP